TLDSTFKNLFRQIPFRRVGNQRNHALPWPKALGDLDGGVHVGASARSSQHAFACRQFSYHAKSLVIGDHHDFVANRTVKIPRNKIVADAFHLVWTGLSSTENRALRLYRHGVHLRDPLFQETGNSSKSSGRAAADRDGIDAPLHLFK